MSDWRPVARDHYDPLKAGSIDGTDKEPHDRAVWRAMNVHYVPPDVDAKPSHTLFIGRLPHTADEEQLHHKFSMFGVVEKIYLIRDIVTGYSKGYCFVKYRKERDAENAMRESTGLLINGCPVLVDWEAGHKVKGWVPRRLGGGWGGRKEAGQLRFGCRDRPWKKPIVIHPKKLSQKQDYKDVSRIRSQDKHGSREDGHSSGSREDWHNIGSREDFHSIGPREGMCSTGSRNDWQNTRSREDRYSTGSREGWRSTGSREDLHSTKSKDDWHNVGSREDWRSKKDLRHKEKKWREDRKDRHTDSSIPHKKIHTSTRN